MSAITPTDTPTTHGAGVSPSEAAHAIPFDEQLYLASGAIDGVPYLIVTADGRHIAGRAGRDGMLPRIETPAKMAYTVYWADEALARTKGDDDGDAA